MDHEYITSTGKSFDERHIIMYSPRERKELLYPKLHDAKMTKTSTDKKISVIVVRLNKKFSPI